MKSTNHEARHDSSTSPQGHQSEQGADSLSKRALLKAAWVAPVVVAVALPRSGFAANISGGHNARPNGDHESKGNNGNHFGQVQKGG